MFESHELAVLDSDVFRAAVFEESSQGSSHILETMLQQTNCLTMCKRHRCMLGRAWTWCEKTQRSLCPEPARSRPHALAFKPQIYDSWSSAKNTRANSPEVASVIRFHFTVSLSGLSWFWRGNVLWRSLCCAVGSRLSRAPEVLAAEYHLLCII